MISQLPRNRERKTVETMNALVVLCLLPLALAAPSAREQEKRLIESIGLPLGNNPFNLDTLKCDVQLILDVVGSDPAEITCENECHKVLMEGHVLNYGCPFVCHGFQEIVHTFNIKPGTNDCNGVSGTTLPTTPSA